MLYQNNENQISEKLPEAVSSPKKQRSGVFGLTTAALVTAAVFFFALMSECISGGTEIVTSFAEKKADSYEFETNGVSASVQAF